MGYIFVLTIGILALLAIFVAVSGGRRRRNRGTPVGQDVTVKKPASEQQPTPGASSTERQASIEAAQKRVDPS